MKKPLNPTTQLDMFAVLEQQTSAAGFPKPGDTAGALALYRALTVRYDAAMCAGDTERALDAKEEADKLLMHMHGAALGSATTARQLMDGCAAQPGTVPLWGQVGEFTLTIASVPMRVNIDGMNGLGQCVSLLPHFDCRAVEKTRLFLSETGYRSFFTGITTAPALSLLEAVKRVLEGYVAGELKGKLKAIKPKAPKKERTNHD